MTDRTNIGQKISPLRYINALGDIEEVKCNDKGEITNRPVPAGNYKAMLRSVEQSVSKAGNEMLVFTYELLHPLGDEPLGHYEREYYVKRQLWRIDWMLEALGIQKTDDLPALAAAFKDYYGLTIAMAVK